MLEERLGWFGHTFTTTLVLVAGLGIMAWAGEMFWSKAFYPIYSFVSAGINRWYARKTAKKDPMFATEQRHPKGLARTHAAPTPKPLPLDSIVPRGGSSRFRDRLVHRPYRAI